MTKKNQKTSEEMNELKAKANIAKTDFANLLQPGKIAFYKSCEVTHFFLYHQEEKEYINYFTLFTFEEKGCGDDSKNQLFPKMHRVDRYFSLGAWQKRISIEKAIQCFSDIQNNKLDIDGIRNISPELVLLPKTLVPRRHDGKNFMIKALKRNIWCGNYVIEFFDERKDLIFKGNQRDKIDKINAIIKDVLDIDLSSIYDRIGNIIFQFPVTLLNLHVHPSKDGTAISVQCRQHPSLIEERNYFIQVQTYFDNCITGSSCKHLKSLNFDYETVVGDDHDVHVSLFDCDNDLLLFDELKINFLKSVSTNFSIIDSGEPRTFPQRDGTFKEIQTTQSMESNVGIIYSAKSYQNRIHERFSNNEIIAQSGDYRILKVNQSNEALSFLRDKLKRSDIKEICLWDPYLNAQDIMDILYYEPTGRFFRCISSVAKANSICKDDDTEDCAGVEGFNKFCNRNRQIFKQSNNKNVRLKFLAQHGHYGWKFHDRFMILVPQDSTKLPETYSLGISVNQLGMSHHIIQNVTNSKAILNHFEELWQELDNDKCCVIQLPEMQGNL